MTETRKETAAGNMEVFRALSTPCFSVLPYGMQKAADPIGDGDPRPKSSLSASLLQIVDETHAFVFAAISEVQVQRVSSFELLSSGAFAPKAPPAGHAEYWSAGIVYHFWR